MNGTVKYTRQWASLGTDAHHEHSSNVLSQSDQPSFKMLDYFPIPTTVVKSDTSIIYVNPAHEELTGFSATEVVGRKFPYPWWSPSLKEQVDRLGGYAVLKKHRSAIQTALVKKSGEQLVVITTCARIRYRNKTTYYIVNRFDINNLSVIDEATSRVQRSLGKIILQNEQRSMLSPLTSRQHQVLQLLAYGYSNTAIAQCLNIALKSVESHINAIYQELHISCEPESHSRVKAALLYFSNWNTTKLEV